MSWDVPVMCWFLQSPASETQRYYSRSCLFACCRIFIHGLFSVCSTSMTVRVKGFPFSVYSRTFYALRIFMIFRLRKRWSVKFFVFYSKHILPDTAIIIGFVVHRNMWTRLTHRNSAGNHKLWLKLLVYLTIELSAKS